MRIGHAFCYDAEKNQRRLSSYCHNYFLIFAVLRKTLCVQCQNGTTNSTVSTYADRLLLIPGLLEYGPPSHDVWPDNPEWEERQITCDFGVRVLRPGLFSDLVVRLNSADGRRQLRIVADPLPVFLSHHAVFFAAVDQVRADIECENIFYTFLSRRT